MNADKRPIAIIGAGFSGTMVALHLMARSQRSILLCERGEHFARGVAYGTHDPGHLLNVRAANMSAYPDRPDHFVRWLEADDRIGSADIHATAAGTFVARSLYGRYLADLLRGTVGTSDGAQRLILLADEVTGLKRDGDGYALALAGGRRVEVAGAVLAMGNLAPKNEDPAWVACNPWTGSFTDNLRQAVPVLVLGTGLTMVDVAQRLRHSGFGGPVVALSRRGLLPQAHAAAPPWPAPRFTAEERRSTVRLLRRLRAEVRQARDAGTSWHAVLDSVRPAIGALWQGLPEGERRRFLRHARPWWDIHRHRLAGPVAADLQHMLGTGFLEVHAGRVHSLAPQSDGTVLLTWCPRGGADVRSMTVQSAIDATGIVPISRVDHPLVRQLGADGLVRPDKLDLGFDMSADGALVDTDGRPSTSLWTLGPLGRGVLWECTAVPDIRNQAVVVAEQIAAALG